MYMPIYIGNKDLFLMESVFSWRVAGLHVSSVTGKLEELTLGNRRLDTRCGGCTGEGAGEGT
jgi:hypothetical protein